MLQYKQAFTSFPTSALPPLPRPPGELSAAEPEIDTMILLDRGIDMVTPLVLPLTYEALVDHIIGIDTGEVTHRSSCTCRSLYSFRVVSVG